MADYDTHHPYGSCITQDVSRFTLYALLALCLLAFAASMYCLGAHSLWLDEALYIGRATLDPIQLVLVHGGEGTHPPLYQMIVRVWVSLVGASPFAVRFLAVAGLVLLIPLTFAMGRQLFSGSVGLVAAGLTALSPLLLYHAQEVKSVTLTTCLGLLCVYTFTAAVTRHRRRDWLGYTAASIAAVYVFYLNVFILIAQAIWLLWHHDRVRAFWKPWVLSWGVIAAAYGPWLLLVLILNQPRPTSTIAPPPTVTPLDTASILDGYGQWLKYVPDALAALVTGYITPLKIMILLLFLAIAGLALRLWPRFRQRSDPGGPRLLLLTVAVYPTLAYVVGVPIRFYDARYQAAVIPLIALLTAAALSLVTAWRRGVAILLGVSLMGSTALAALGALWATPRPLPVFPPSTYLPVVQYVNCQSRPDDALVVDQIAWIGFFASYGRGPLLPWSEPGRAPYGNAEEVLDRLLRDHPRLWLITTEGIGSNGPQFQSWLDSHAYLAASIPHDNSTIYLYGAPPAASVEQHPAIAYGQTLRLARYTLDTGPVTPGQVLGIHLTWQCLARMDRNYHVSLRLVDAHGDLVSQCDRQPTNGRRPTSTWQPDEIIEDRIGLLVPGDSAPGPYTVGIVVYDLADGQALVAFDARGAPLGHSVPLGTALVGPGTYYPPPSCLSPTHPLSAQFDHLQLLGYDLGATDLRPGDRLPLTLYWHALRQPLPDYTIRVRLVGEDGREAGQVIQRPVGDTYPTPAWPPGAIVRDRWAVPVAAGAASGRYQVLVQATAAGSGASAPAEISCGVVQVTARPHVYDAPGMSHPQAARFGEGVELLGYTLTADGRALAGDEMTIRPGEVLSLTLFWRCRAEMDASYTVFVHVLDAESRPQAGRDTLPCDGDCPTLGWVPGEVLADTRVVPIPADVSGGALRLEIGLYDAQTGQRLPAFGPAGPEPGSRILLDTILRVSGEVTQTSPRLPVRASA